MEQSRPAQAAQQERLSNPFRPSNLLALFVRPGRFFGDQVALRNPRFYEGVAWAAGVVYACGRVDQMTMRSPQLASLPPEQVGFIALFAQSWVAYWLFALVLGAVAGVAIWYIGGWWYHVRIRWSGADDADRREARIVYVWTSLISVIPSLMFLVVQTARYRSCLASLESADLWGAAVLPFVPWSFAVSYCAVRKVFAVRRGRAVFWFLILPTLVFVVGVVGLVLLGALGRPNASLL